MKYAMTSRPFSNGIKFEQFRLLHEISFLPVAEIISNYHNLLSLNISICWLIGADDASQFCSINIGSTWQISRTTQPLNCIHQSSIMVVSCSWNHLGVTVEANIVRAVVIHVLRNQITMVLPGPTRGTSHPGGDHYHAASIICSTDCARSVMFGQRCVWRKTMKLVFNREHVSSVSLTPSLEDVIFGDLGKAQVIRTAPWFCIPLTSGKTYRWNKTKKKKKNIKGIITRQKLWEASWSKLCFASPKILTF